jgi:hypothetical protein
MLILRHGKYKNTRLIKHFKNIEMMIGERIEVCILIDLFRKLRRKRMAIIFIPCLVEDFSL